MRLNRVSTDEFMSELNMNTSAHIERFNCDLEEIKSRPIKSIHRDSRINQKPKKEQSVLYKCSRRNKQNIFA